MRMFVGGDWVEGATQAPVLNPFDGSVVDTVPQATVEDVNRALATAKRGAEIMAKMSAWERYQLLQRAVVLMRERVDDLAQTITLEGGKIAFEARVEAERTVEIINLSSEEAKRIYGEVLPLDAAANVTGQFGFTMRVPCGVVVAITPFNFPLHLVSHKVGPALAAGNSVIIKPASDTPLSALKFTEILLEAGVPPEAIQCITGPGSVLGQALCSDPRVRKISFTGSRDVGEQICRAAGIKKVTMELGSNAPLIIMPDADMEKVVAATVSTGFAHAGQVCISAQRILTHGNVYGDFIDALSERLESHTVGDPRDANVKMGPMIRETDAIRVNEWIHDAVSNGARLVRGGERDGTLHQPTIVADVDPKMRISCDELFGPAVAVTRINDIDEAIALANDTIYGLSAGVFTENIHDAMRFAREIRSGNVMINWGPQWRADLMPYGGLKESGIGKEGPKYAVEEMTETKMVVFH